jgi:O-antigen/teichoic acid export membrane protein
LSEPAASRSSPASSLRRDVISAYAATGSKILSWVIVLGLVYRFVNVAEFAMLALIRGTIGILNYTSLGLSPAMIRILAEARTKPPIAAMAVAPEPEVARPTLSYYTADPDDGVVVVYANALVIAAISGVIGILVTFGYAVVFNDIYSMPARLLPAAPVVVLCMGIGTVLRLMSDAPGSVLQAQGLIAKDNWRLVEAEAAWALLSIGITFSGATRDQVFTIIAAFYMGSGFLLLLRRTYSAQELTQLPLRFPSLVRRTTLKRLLGFGVLVLFAQLADYLYAPTDYILINFLLGWESVATYTPAMTVDSGLLLLVTGLSSVILPRTAIAHTAGEMERVRRYYIWGTIFSAFLLVVAAGAIWLISPILFQLWLGSSMPATRAILPLVLIHTVVGGSSAVGRSILLGMGRVRAFTISVLIAGVANVVLSYIFVRHLNLGLKGIVLGTITVVVARAGLWMPWYVLRTLRRESH